MGLKKKITAKDFEALEEGLKGFYTKATDGDDYFLQVEGDEDKQKLKEFRDKNNELLKKHAEISEKLKPFEGLDADAAREALQKMQGLADKKLIEEGKIDELIGKRTERMKAEYEGQVKKLTEALEASNVKNSKYKERLNKEIIDARLSAAVSNVGTVRKGAMPDILRRGRNEWKLDEDGNPVPYDSDGNVRYGSDAKTVMKTSEWAAELAQTAPFFFEDTRGAGGQGNKGKSSSNVGDKVIDSSDKVAFGQNLDKIADGTVKVHMQ